MNESGREIAHDLNNLLTAILGAATAALERPGLSPETAEDLAQIVEGTRRGAALIRTWRGDPPPAAAPVWLNDTIRATARLLDAQAGPGVTLVLDLAEPDGLVRIEPAALDRVLQNLTANARHAMPAGGTLTIRTAPDAGPRRVIQVIDTGVGIAPEDQDRIFAPGFTTRGGSGLGLVSVREAVNAAGGVVTVAPAEGRGTAVTIHLPEVHAPESRVVLVVEDDPMVLAMTGRILRRAGWTVLTAGSAEEALGLLDLADCDLLISDITLPGMDGKALAAAVLARWPERAVILTSGYAEDRTGIDPRIGFLAKPFEREALLDAAARGLEGPGS